MTNVQYVLCTLTNGVYPSNQISNLHDNFKKQVWINDSLVVYICNFTFYIYIYIYSLHLLFCCILSILALIWLVLIIYSLRVFISVLSDDLSLEIKWQQVSSSLQDSSQYSGCSRSRYLSFFSHSFSFLLWSAGTAKSTIFLVLSLFYLFIYLFILLLLITGLLAEIRWSVCMSKSHRSLCVSFSRTNAGLCCFQDLFKTTHCVL